MKNVIEAFSVLLLTMLCAYASIAIITATSGILAAKEYKADVIAEIECSDFNRNVMESCIAQADEAGYMLQITPCSYDADSHVNTAEVLLTYEYKLPLFGISNKKTTRGIAR